MNTKTLFLLLLLATVNFAHIIDFMIVMPLGNILFEALNIDSQKFSYVVSTYTAAAAISGLTGSLLIDKYGRKKLLILFFCGFILGTFYCGIAETYLQLLMGRAVSGIFGGLISALVLSAASDLVPIEKRGTAMGIVMTAFSVASVVGVPFGLYLAELNTWQTPFLVLAAFSALVLILLAFFLPRLEGHLSRANNSGWINIKEVVSMPNARRAFLLMFLLVFGQFCVIPFITPYLIQNAGMEQGHIKFIYLLGGLATIVTSPLVGRWADKYGKYKIFTIAAVLVILPLYGTTNIGQESYWILYMVTTSFFIFGSGRMVPAVAIMSSSVPAQKRGTFMSLNSAVQQFGSSFAALVAGSIVVVKDSGLENYNIVGYIAIVFTLICVLFVKRVKLVE